ncbi:MAG TPA: Rne/Rng family ribonuclease [Syntrophomonadaceae bacterium]|nr:Rne/Rng family ribonuclease [Syntrophomonadaceae bacterium]
MARDIIAEVYPWESRVAIVDDDRLVEVFWAGQDENVGNIYKGKVKDVIPGLSCAFVDIGLAKNAFLFAGDILLPGKSRSTNIMDVVKSGQDVMVQVKKEAFSEKGARVTGDITIPGHLLVLLPFQSEVSISRKIMDNALRENLKQLVETNKPDNVGVILRTACMDAEEDDILDELEKLLAAWSEINRRYEKGKAPCLIYEDIDVIERTLRDYLDSDINRVIINNEKLMNRINTVIKSKNMNYGFKVQYVAGDLFEKYGLEKDIKRAIKRKVWLKSGGYLVFDETEAMTVIDVNSGKYTGHDDFEETVFKLNMEASVEIPRQLRLRSIGGIILIDFIDMKNKDNEKSVVQTLKKELEKDKAHTRIMGMTELGFLEMTRKKSRYGISQFFTDDCSVCHGRGHIINLYALSCEVKRKLCNLGYLENDTLVCEANPQLLKFIQEDTVNLDFIRRRSQKELKFVANPGLAPVEYNIYGE